MCNAASMAAVQSVAESTIPFCHQWTVLGQTDHSWTPRKSLQWQHGGAVPHLRNLPLLTMSAPPRDQGLSACCCSFPCCTAGCGHLNCKPRDRGIKGHQLLEGLPLITGILAEWHLSVASSKRFYTDLHEHHYPPPEALPLLVILLYPLPSSSALAQTT